MDDDWLCKETLAQWMIDEKLLEVLFRYACHLIATVDSMSRDNLHHAQYVAKLEDVIKFLMSEKKLTLDHLSSMWDLQVNAP